MDTHVEFIGKFFAQSENMATPEFIGELLASLVHLHTDEATPPGCAMMQAGGSGVASNSEACAVTLKMKTNLESDLHGFFKSKHDQGEQLSAPPHILAKFIVGTIQGLSQLTCDGNSREDMLAVADHAAKSCALAN